MIYSDGAQTKPKGASPGSRSEQRTARDCSGNTQVFLWPSFPSAFQDFSVFRTNRVETQRNIGAEKDLGRVGHPTGKPSRGIIFLWNVENAFLYLVRRASSTCFSCNIKLIKQYGFTAARVWEQLRQAVSIEQNVSAMTVAIYLLLGAAMSLYIRFLYRQCGSSPNDADAITRIFPLLTMVTIGVISVVKSSMALSLGLVGALSIVRFRAAIKEPEELVYLFLCIGVGLALGAGQPLLAVVLVVVVSVVVLSMHFSMGGRREQKPVVDHYGRLGKIL